MHAEEIGVVWGSCGLENEWQPLRSVLLHTPGEELTAVADPSEALMLDAVDLERARQEHQALIQSYITEGVEVNLVAPEIARPNQMFCADLFAMTPEGAILARPASSVRAGEEREVARRLADLGIPILKTLTRDAVFEGADLMWLDRKTALLGKGLRTNDTAARQITQLMDDLGVTLICVDMPVGTMHLMGMLRIVDRDLAIAWPRRTPLRAITALQQAGYRVVFIPEGEDFDRNRAVNFVTLGPRRILMVAGNDSAREFYESHGIECVETPATELTKAAGAVGCLTGIIARY